MKINALFMLRDRKSAENFRRLHHKGFTGRLFAMFMHYGRCPIVYNVIEGLKTKIAVSDQI
jgi:hypothetical protein